MKNHIVSRKSIMMIAALTTIISAISVHTNVCAAEKNCYSTPVKKLILDIRDDSSKSTIWISKYDSSSNYVDAVGDNGSSSLYSYFDTDYYTSIPFSFGNCDAAVNGSLLSVNYAREMYSGHQSNSVLTINTDTMQKQTAKGIYSSHSFGQRVSAYKDGFIYASEGDCYPRAFTIDYVSGTCDTSDDWADDYFEEDDYSEEQRGHVTNDIFHFWVRPNALSDWNMTDLNNNFAHIGDLVNISDERATFVGTSAAKLNSTAKKEQEQLFIQIFDPTVDLSSGSGFYTSGTRSGLSGPDGDKRVTDYGVKWLTESSKYTVSYPQMIYDDAGHLIILFEQYKKWRYQGVYYMVLDKDGNVLTKRTRFMKKSRLNPCETPKFVNGAVTWAGNKVNSDKIYVFTLKL